MLDTDTKRRIDTARDILVGKVPDPKSQVEQITIALIYKFMDDMDAEAEELGGKRKFFTGDFARYGWAKLMRSGLGGHETLALYGEGITKMTENPGLPPLFRDIFKNAYLPYRDPETLKAFLKIIDEFTYDHSERLGDAFEYLLSVLGSQGDAGQFRTPRHIIDFIVALVDPKKTETVLDPACGTAGFLISSFKHILRANTNEHGHSTLTPDERGNLAKNFKGYDISPDMVRLSLVNLYLHGFTDPHIYEYDTLTSEERWNEFADVILANPPFMSPKGGIKPHRRFSMQSKRSEVLFVDYMAEHLTPTGRAGIIVPEGIIFQSQGSYVELRRMLVENSLVAVISLPAGVFNPYSGVKTSILILDKSLARQASAVGFFKVENDGFGLGAQRRAIEKNDLPHVQADIASWLGALRTNQSTDELLLTTGLIVAKDKIAANGDYNLSGERYREGTVAVSSWPFVPVGDVFRKADETVLPESLKGPVTYLGLENLTQNTGEIEGNVVSEKPSDIKSIKNVFKPDHILYGKLRPNLNKVWLADRSGICSTDIFVIEGNNGKTVPALYAYLFRSSRFNDAVMGQLKGAQLPRIGWSSFAQLQIPLPPLEVQKEIVAEIEGYQEVINGARAVLDHYRPHIPIHADWPMVPLAEVCESFQYGSSLKSSENGEVVCLRMGNIQNGKIDWSDLKFAPPDEDLEKYLLSPNDVLFNRTNSPIHVGKTGIYRGERPAVFAGYLIRLNYRKEKIMGQYLNFCLNTKEAKEFCLRVKTDGINQSNINATILGTFAVPLPPLATQQAIVAEIEAEQALVAANRELITRFEKKTQATLARVWGEDE
ncbi:MAG: N-6 DNA methylase [Terrimicrobiaceae bacterium]|nr:N-6 DNA methylase [Terrimicrobiaceae bacterium]